MKPQTFVWGGWEGLFWQHGILLCCVQVTHAGLSCDQEAPVCGATCGKLLPCGRHACQERCHPGSCSATCRAMVEKSCACGKMQKTVLCAEPLR